MRVLFWSPPKYSGIYLFELYADMEGSIRWRELEITWPKGGDMFDGESVRESTNRGGYYYRPSEELKAFALENRAVLVQRDIAAYGNTRLGGSSFRYGDWGIKPSDLELLALTQTT